MKERILISLGVVLASASLGLAQTTNAFQFTGAAQQWTAPTNVSLVFFSLLGASGGNATERFFTYGGVGFRVSGLLAVNPGETLQLYVGGAGRESGAGAAGGFNGGGNGIANQGGGGGGATDIRRFGNSFSNIVAIAGAGGGANTVGGYGGSDSGLGLYDTNSLLQGRPGISPIYQNWGYGGGGGGYFGGLGGGEFISATGFYASAGCGGSSWVNTNQVVAASYNLAGPTGPATSQRNGLLEVVYAASPLQTWRYAFFANTNNSGDSGDPADPDQDGISNLLEYALGGDPNIPDASSIAPTIAHTNGQVRIGFRCNSSKSDIDWIVQVSPSLSQTDWVSVAQSTGGAEAVPLSAQVSVSDSGSGNRIVTVTQNPENSNKFWRVKIAPSN